MPFEFIQIPASGQGSAKEELNRFLRGGRIASVRKEFVGHGEDSFWAFCIEYLDGPVGGGKGGATGPKVDYKEVLNETDFAVFSRLRALRKKMGKLRRAGALQSGLRPRKRVWAVSKGVRAGSNARGGPLLAFCHPRPAPGPKRRQGRGGP